MRIREIASRSSINTLFILFSLMSTVAYAHQPTPPVSIDTKVVETNEKELIVEVIVTPNIEVDGAKFSIKTQGGISVDAESTELNGEVKKSQTIKVRLSTEEKEPLRVDFTVEAKAKNYLRAGGSARRYLTRDDKGVLTLITGAQLRDQAREGAFNRLENLQRQGNGEGRSIYDLLTGPLRKVDVEKIDFEKIQPQLLAPPAGGIEQLEADAIVDSTKDNIRDVDPITVTGSFFFVDRSGVTRPLVNATVDIRDSDTFGDEQLTSVITDWDGSYSAVVNADDGWLQNGRDIYVRVRTTNARFRVQDCGGANTTFTWTSTVMGDLSDGAVANFGNQQPGSDMDAAVIFQDLNDAWNHITSTGSQDPGFVNLCWPENASNYDFSNINIEDGDEVAEDIVVHEYAHAIMHNAYDNNFWPANATGPHTLCDTTPQNRNLAFTEGWASFIALAVNPDGVYDSTSFSWDQENNSCSNVDGTTDETMVTAGLLDMRDTLIDGNCVTGNCDPSGNNNVSMVDLWRDTVFAQNINNTGEFWDVLCPELSEAEHDDAIASLSFNNINVPQCQCTAELTFASSNVTSAQSARLLTSLREFRDVGLLKTTMGRRMVKQYYQHNQEASKIVLSNPSLIADAFAVFSTVARSMDNYKLGKGTDGPLLDAKAADAAMSLTRALRENASEELSAAIFEAQRLIDPASSVPMSRMEHLLNKPNPK